MKTIYYDEFATERRIELVKVCAKYIILGMKAFYILPSREAMFRVRRLFTEEMGGIFNIDEDFKKRGGGR